MNENVDTVAVTDSDSIKKIPTDNCANSNNNNNHSNNNNFLNINNNNNVEKSYAHDVNSVEQKNNKKHDEISVNRDYVNVMSVKCNISDDTTKSIQGNIDIESVDHNVDVRSTKSNNSSNTDIDVEIPEKDERKTFSVNNSMLPIPMNDTINWADCHNSLEKTTKSSVSPSYSNRETGSMSNQQTYDVNGLNMITSNLKKEVCVEDSFI